MLLFSINTFWSLTQALSTLRRVLVARLTAMLTASAKLWSETALISFTRATVIRYSFLRLSLKDFLPLYIELANASLVLHMYTYVGLAIILLGRLYPSW